MAKKKDFPPPKTVQKVFQLIDPCRAAKPVLRNSIVGRLSTAELVIGKKGPLVLIGQIIKKLEGIPSASRTAMDQYQRNLSAIGRKYPAIGPIASKGNVAFQDFHTLYSISKSTKRIFCPLLILPFLAVVAMNQDEEKDEIGCGKR